MINLVPKEIRDSQKATSSLYYLATVYIVVISLFILALGIINTLNFVRTAQNSNIQNEIDQLASQVSRQNEIVSKAALLEERVKTASNYKETRNWERLFISIASNTPTTIQLNSIKVSRDAARGNQILVNITGTSADRRTVVLFKDRLASDKNYQSVTIQSIDQLETEGAAGHNFTILTTVKEGVFENQ